MPAITSHPAVALELLHHAWRWCHVRCQSTAPARDIEMVSCCVRQHVIQLPPCARLLGCKLLSALTRIRSVPRATAADGLKPRIASTLVKLLLDEAPSLTVCARHSPHTSLSRRLCRSAAFAKSLLVPIIELQPFERLQLVLDLRSAFRADGIGNSAGPSATIAGGSTAGCSAALSSWASVSVSSSALASEVAASVSAPASALLPASGSASLCQSP